MGLLTRTTNALTDAIELIERCVHLGEIGNDEQIFENIKFAHRQAKAVLDAAAARRAQYGAPAKSDDDDGDTTGAVLAGAAIGAAVGAAISADPDPNPEPAFSGGGGESGGGCPPRREHLHRKEKTMEAKFDYVPLNSNEAKILVAALRAYIKTDAFDNDVEGVAKAGILLTKLATRAAGKRVVS